MENTKIRKITGTYFNIVTLSFFTFLFAVLSLGRAFSIMCVSVFGFKIFITEIFILISLPLLFLCGRGKLGLPRGIMISGSLFFSLGCLYFCKAIINLNLFSLRDIVLFVYLLFLPLTLIIFSEKKKLVYYVAIVIASNFLNLLIGWLMFKDFSIFKFKFLAEQIRYFNLGLYYGMSIAFLIPLLSIISKKKLRIFVILLIAINMCFIIFAGLRTLWIGLIALFIYFLLVQRFSFIKVVLNICVVLIPLSILLLWIGFGNNSRDLQGEFVKSKFKTMIFFLQNKSKAMEIVAKDNYDQHETADAPRSLRKFPTPGRYVPLDRSPNICNLTWRIEVWKQSIMFGMKSPLFGRGFGVYPRYKIYHDPYYEEGSLNYFLESPKRIDVNSGVTPAHNYLITIFFKMGFVGLTLFLFMNIYALSYGVRHVYKMKDEFLRCFLVGSLGAFVFWHAIALFFNVIDSPPTSIFLWIIIGLVFATVKIDEDLSEKGRDASFPQKSGHGGKLVIE